MATLNPYLTFNGNCEEAFGFYRSVFGGEFGYTGRFGEMPEQENQPPLADSERQKIMHISLPVSKETTLMGCDSPEGWGFKHIPGNNITISVNAESKVEADRLFAGLSAGGKQTMPMAHTFWGAYFGMFTDKFGIHWMVSFDESQS